MGKFSRDIFEIRRLDWSFIAWIICFLVASWSVLAKKTDGNSITNAINSDGIGYYSYLPALFIYNDMSYSFMGQKDSPYPGLNSGREIFANKKGDRVVNKYFAGEAVCILPFFWIADLVVRNFEYPRDGFSFWYSFSVVLAGWFYLLLGLYFLRKLLLKLGNSEVVTAFTILAAFLCTGLYHYGLEEYYMSHVYSFAFAAIFLERLKTYIDKPGPLQLILVVFLFGMIVLIRPVNALYVFSFGIFLNRPSDVSIFLKNVLSSRSALFAAFVIIMLLAGIQSVMYYLQTGDLWVYSYGNEHLNFLKPEFINVLFSWRKGLFIYTPLLLLSIPGIYLFGKEKGWFSAMWLGVLIFLFTWMISSWWIWSYGGGLGMRPFVEVYPLFFIPFASFAAFMFSQKWTAVLLISLTGFLAFLNLFQEYQYNTGIIPYDNMTESRYKRIFLQSGKQFALMFSPWGEPGDPIEDFGGRKVNSTFFDFEKIDPTKPSKAYSNEAFGGTKGISLNNSTSKYIHLFEKNFDQLAGDSLCGTYGLRVSGMMKLEDATGTATLVVSACKDNKCCLYSPLYLIHRIHESDKWVKFDSFFLFPPEVSPDQFLMVSFFNDNEAAVLMDNMTIDLYQKD